MRYYPALIETAEDNSYGVAFPEFPGCAAAGDTVEQAMAHRAEALALHVDGLPEDGEPVPGPTRLGAPLPEWLDDVAGPGALVGLDLPGRAVRVNVTLDEGLLGRIYRIAAANLGRLGYLGEAVLKHDLIRKRLACEAVPGLRRIVYVWVDEVRLDMRVRSADGVCGDETAERLDRAVLVPEIGVRLPLAEMHEDTELAVARSA